MRFFRDLLLTVLATACAILAVEAALRLTGARYEASFYEPDAERGYALRPKAEGWSTSEAEVYVRMNSDAMRDRERPVERPSDALRIAVIGSSEAAAFEVPFEKTFEEVMRRELSAKLNSASMGARKVDVLNFGVPGYTISQSFVTLRDHVWKYDPQVVIFLFSAFTALKNTRQFYPGELKGAPVYVLKDGELTPDAIGRNAPHVATRHLDWRNRLADAMNDSALLSLLNLAKVKLPGAIGPARESLHPAPAQPAAAPPDRRFDPNRPDVRESWQITDAFIKTMKAECERHRAEFWVAAVDLEIQTDPDLSARAVFERSHHLPSLDLVDEHLESDGRTYGVPVVVLSQPLGEYAATHRVYLHGREESHKNVGHWNEIGHEQVGKLLAGELWEKSPAVSAAKR